MVIGFMDQRLENAKKIKQLEATPLYNSMAPAEQGFLIEKALEFNLSFQQFVKLTEISIDLHMWGLGGVKTFWEKFEPKTKDNLPQIKRKIFSQITQEYQKVQSDSKIYNFDNILKNNYQKLTNVDLKSVEITSNKKILGECPVSSEKTLCCNLMTLDAVENCGFECSYCSIQSFYPHNKIFYKKSLLSKLQAFNFEKEKIYHIGTGQSSDSLFIGNQGGVLDQLMIFAKENPNIILEFKTKSKNINYFLKNDIPKNVIVTWSLNPDSIIKTEEISTASLGDRLKAAKALSKKRILIGFHFHPMIYSHNHQAEYKKIAQDIQYQFRPEQIAMISIGTLTFTKPTIRAIRKKKIYSNILKIKLVEASGKLSYPEDIKIELFKNLYDSFSKEWKENVFFYLCMEKKELWPKIFGKGYQNNKEFEKSLTSAYMKKIDHLSAHCQS